MANALADYVLPSQFPDDGLVETTYEPARITAKAEILRAKSMTSLSLTPDASTVKRKDTRADARPSGTSSS